MAIGAAMSAACSGSDAGKRQDDPAQVASPPKSAPPVNAPAQGWDERYVTVPALGKITAYVPKQSSSHVVLLISGEGGWNATAIQMARRIAPTGIVIGLSFDALRKAQGKPKCWLPGGVLEEIAKSAETQLNLPQYRSPVLVGYGPGAALVYASLAPAPLGTFSGALSLGFVPDVATSVQLCAIPTWHPAFDAAKNTAHLPKTSDIQRDWYLLHGTDDTAFTPAQTAQFLAGMAHAHDVPIAGMGRELNQPAQWGAAFDDGIAKLFASDVVTETRTAAPNASAAELERRLDALKFDLDYQWAEHPKASLIFISGDGGWRDIDQHLAAYLAPRGVNVIGLSSAVYFWKAKTPEQGGADLRRMADIVADANVPIFVGGYSFGADVVPFLLDAWPAADRQKVSGQVLVAPSPTASFVLDLLGYEWLPGHRTTTTHYVVADAVRRIHLPTFCLTGVLVKPADTPCLAVADVDIVDVVKLPGDHHFNGNYDAIGAAAIAFIEKNLLRR